MIQSDQVTLDMDQKDFHHPFRPYEIQQQLMEAVYACIEDGKVGIFESPTGTGKTLSLICSSLTWLRENKRKRYDDALACIQVDEEEPEWMIAHAKEARRKEFLRARTDLEARLEVIRAKEQAIRRRHQNGEPLSKKTKRTVEDASTEDAQEDRFLLDDYESDEATGKSSRPSGPFSSETTALMENLGLLQAKGKQRDDESIDEAKIYFCSRTHSQLSQFVGELQRVHMPPSLPSDEEPTQPSEMSRSRYEQVKALSLGSRKNLCVNPKVRKLRNATAMNERCLEMQQKKSAQREKCAFLPTKENEDLMLDFKDHALARIRDIEDLAAIGTKLAICPYYASRPAIGPAEVVTLPYPLLLQKAAREALGISLKGHVVIIDEAHNLINAIEGVHAVEISENQLHNAREALMIYLKKFRNRLKGSNRMYLTQVVRVVDSLSWYFKSIKDVKSVGGIVNPNDLLHGKGVDQINLTKLVRYISESKLAMKIEGYIAHMVQADPTTRAAGPRQDGQTVSPATLMHVQSFLSALINPSREGQFLWSCVEDTYVLRFMLLDPSEHFKDIVDNARAVILAGGTMAPMDDYKQQLLPYLDEVRTFSCGHLIPPSNLLVRIVSCDSLGKIDCSFKGRTDSLISRIGAALLRLTAVVTDGLVVFFPSYTFLGWAMDTWRNNGVLSQLSNVKPVYADDRKASADTSFEDYVNSINEGTSGATLFSVLGGKLSEGINFSDQLGRCVVVIGLPFPNLHTSEWKAKLKYIDDNAKVEGISKGKAGSEHAENVCMRAVNQAIGRVIRHKGDWASIVLMDARYEQERVRGKLPGWISSNLPPLSLQNSALVEVTKNIAAFMKEKKS